MLLKLFSIYDCKVEAYLQPFFLKSRGEATRAFTDLVNDSKTNICKYPQDFTLFELGSYDDSNAKFTLHSTPIALGVAIEYITQPTSFSTPVNDPISGDNIRV